MGAPRPAGGARWLVPCEPGVENDPSRNLLAKGLSIYQADAAVRPAAKAKAKHAPIPAKAAKKKAPAGKKKA